MLKRLSLSTLLAALVLVFVFAAGSEADDRAKRTEDVSIQIIATASNNGEIEECG